MKDPKSINPEEYELRLLWASLSHGVLDPDECKKEVIETVRELLKELGYENVGIALDVISSWWEAHPAGH